MKKSEFQQSWDAFAKALNAKNNNDHLNVELADIEYLKKLEAHEDLIVSAKNCHITEAFNIAPNKKARKFSPDWMFKNSITIGQDGRGNFAIWMDVSKMDSLVLFVCHDPSEVTVLAKSPADFFDDLRVFLTSYGPKNHFGLLDEYLKNWEPEIETVSKIVHSKQMNIDIFDFGVANVGDRVALDHRGKNTIVKESNQRGVLLLTDEEESVIRSVKRRDQIWYIGLLSSLAMGFSFFYILQKKSIMISFLWTLMSFLMFFFVMMMMLDQYCIWRSRKRKICK